MDKNRFYFWRCQKYFNLRAQFVFPNKPSFFNWEVFNIFLRFYKHLEFAAQKKKSESMFFRIFCLWFDAYISRFVLVSGNTNVGVCLLASSKSMEA